MRITDVQNQDSRVVVGWGSPAALLGRRVSRERGDRGVRDRERDEGGWKVRDKRARMGERERGRETERCFRGVSGGEAWKREGSGA